MGVSLLAQPALNASAVPLNFPPLSRPDISNCDGYYSYPTAPVHSDCQTAFLDLPSGTAPSAWYTKPAAGQQRNVLPLEVHHGTCVIIFHTSGQSAESVDPTYIVPNDIRAMAAWVLDSCCKSGKGGMVTKGLGQTIDSMLDTSVTQFPNPPLPPSSSFYSLHVWNFMPTGDIDWNPGNNDPDVGGVLDDKLTAASFAAARGGPRQKELRRREKYLWEAVGPMKYGEPTYNWWDGSPTPGLSSSAHQLALNGTGGAVSLTHGCYANDCDGASAVS